jgi:ATP-dependent helicase/nuclease subunit A
LFKIYSASAGSGKTYTLTKEYLRLALGEGTPLADVTDYRGTYFRHILAITFTNAAANEMKDRILRELSYIAQLTLPEDRSVGTLRADKATHFLLDLTASLVSYANVPGMDSPEPIFEQVAEVQRRAQRLFQRILHRYSDFSVTTIDAFTQRLVMAFTDELGLPYSFEVEMDTELTLELAVDNLIERVGADEAADITEILHEIYAETARDGKSWNSIADSLREFGNVLTADQHYEALGRLAELSPAQLRSIRQQLLRFGADYEDRIQALGQRAWAAIRAAGLDENDFAQKSKGIGAFFKAVAEGDVEKDINSYHRDAIENGNWMGKKPLPGTLATIQGIADGLCSCFESIVAERTDNGKLLTLFRAIDPHLQKMALLQRIRAEFVELLRKDNRVHISEFNKRIKAIVESEPVPFLFERLGSRYNHILIDEFQDTSQLQFANLLPLIENALGSNHFNLAVGDGKQAIYRFRGGDMDQIVALHRRELGTLQQLHGPDTWTAERIDALGMHLRPALLDTNWRSARPIVQFNNAFFDFVARRYAADNQRIDAVYDELKAFQQQPAPNAATEAHIQLDFIGADDVPTDSSLAAEVVARTVAHIRAALAQGYTYGDMAVLTRSRRNAQMVANELNRLGIPLVSADSLSLQFSEPVRFLVALLTMLARPGQKTVRYETLYLYHQVVHNRVPNDAQTEALRLVADASDEQPVFDYLAREGYPLQPALLAQLGVYELAEKLTHGFRLFDRPHDQPFLFRFLDEILTFNGRQSGHLADFLKHWETVKGKVSVSEGLTANAVTIQTIHKSKGLEYPVVIVPFADWGVEPSPLRDSLWVDLSDVDAEALTLPLADGSTVKLLNAQAAMKQELTNTPDSVAGQYRNEKSRAFIENMNLLYVAFTRPTDRLYVIAERKDFAQKRAQDTAAYWLHSFLRDTDVAAQCGCGWEEGRQQYILNECAPREKRTGKATYPAAEAIDLQTINSGSRAQNLQLRRLAERVFDTHTFEQHRERDRKLCAALSLIKGADCIQKTLARLVREGVLRTTELPELQASLVAIVTHPALADAFGYDRRIDTDRSILTRNAAKGAPHRVVHRPDGCIVLMQYESVVGPSESHLETFIDLYHQMGYPQVEARIVWLANEPRVEHVQCMMNNAQ